MLDPVDPSLFYPLFGKAVATLDASGGLDALRCLGGLGVEGPGRDGHVLIALDGTEYHRSAKVRCARCSTLTKSGKTDYFHTMVQAAIVAPGHDRAVPLPPAFVEPQDGHDKQDRESRACRRWLGLHGPRYAALKPVYLGDDLYSKQPICQAVRDAGGHFLFVCKPESHPTLAAYLSGVTIDERVEIVKRGKQRFRHVYRWMSDLPLRDGADAWRVNWLSIEIVDPKGNVSYRNSFVTDLPVDRGHVADLAACGRARWKVENETFNTLKTKGYNLEHNFGHGKQNLAAVRATLNLPAFACHTIADLADDLRQKARAGAHTRTGFFDRLKTITVFAIFPSWTELLETLAFQKPMPQPP